MDNIAVLQANQCSSCLEESVRNATYIDVQWRRDTNGGHWPKPFQESGIDSGRVKAIVVGQDPTIDDSRSIEYVLEANLRNRHLGVFLREMFGMLPNINFDELYFTNLVKCRLREKPGKGNRNISKFIDGLAENCFSQFLLNEIRECGQAKYIFTLGRDTFATAARLLWVHHPPLTKFKDFYGQLFAIQLETLKRECYLVPLPHQPTYDLAKRYKPYSPEEVQKRLKALGRK